MTISVVLRKVAKLVSVVALLGSWLTLVVKARGTESIQEFTARCVKQALHPFDDDCVYPNISQSQALLDIRDKWIVFYGESTLRQMFLQFVGSIENVEWDRIPDQKQNSVIEKRLSGSRFTFTYAPYYDNLTEVILDPPVLFDGRRPDLIVLNDGLHDLLYQSIAKMNQAWEKLAQTLVKVSEQGKLKSPLMWIPPGFIHNARLTLHRAESPRFKNESLSKIVSEQLRVMDGIPGILTYNVYRSVNNDDPELVPDDGVHNMKRARLEADGFIGALHWVSEDPSKWGSHPITVGQIMCLLSYLIVSCLFVSGEISVRWCYKTVPVVTMDDLDDLNDETENLLTADQDSSLQKVAIPLDTRIVGGGDTVITTESISKQGQSSISTEKANKSLNPKHSDKSSDVPVEMEEEEMQQVLNVPDGWDWIGQYLECYRRDKAVYRALFCFGLCIMLVYLNDGPKHMFSPYLKHYNRDLFVFIHIVLLIISGLTMKKESRVNNKLCGRKFTEEWKGIMQIVFVLYHYFDAAEVYNLIRVFIAAYVWMTGFGNTAFFLGRKTYTAVRLFGMLFRLNWLVFWVCLILNQDLMLYYICPLHTFFFLMVYATWGIAYHLNDDAQTGGLNYPVIYVKLFLCLVMLLIMFEIPDMFAVIWKPFAYAFPWIFKYHGTIYEWEFRTRLDHYSAWFGMIFGVFYNECNGLLQYLDSISNSQLKSAYKGSVFAVVSMILYLWYSFVYCHDKYQYNSMHPYTSFIPIFSYLILRNLVFEFRQYFSWFLIWMGQTTLETYIFQYHLYMIDDAKSILTVFHGYPLCNFVFTSVLYVYISRVAFESTDLLRKHLFPESYDKDHPFNNNFTMIRHTLKYCAVILVIYLISLAIHAAVF